jgi:transposase InsO family protein
MAHISGHGKSTPSIFYESFFLTLRENITMSYNCEYLTPKMIENLLKSDKIKKIQNNRVYYTEDSRTFIKTNIKILTKEIFLNYLNVSIEDFGSNRLNVTLNDYRKKFLYHSSKTIIVTEKLKNNKYIKRIKNHTILFTNQFYIDSAALIETTGVCDILISFGIDPSYLGNKNQNNLKIRIKSFNMDRNRKTEDYNYDNTWSKDLYPLFVKKTKGNGFCSLAWAEIKKLKNNYTSEEILFILNISPKTVGYNNYQSIRIRIDNWKPIKKNSKSDDSLLSRKLAILELIKEGLERFNQSIKVSNTYNTVLTHEKCIFAKKFFNLNNKTFALSEILSILQISKSSYYKHIKDSTFNEIQKQKSLKKAMDVKLVLEGFEYRNVMKGSRQIKMYIKRKHNIVIGLKKIQTIMKNNGIICTINSPNPMRRAQKAMKTTNYFKNILDRKFIRDTPNEAICTDISYFFYGNNKKAYLSMFIDATTKKVLKYYVNDTMTVDLATTPLKQLLESDIKLSPNVLVHSDQGCHYSSNDFRSILKEYGITQSMSKKATCWDNSCCESRFAKVKGEMKYKYCKDLDDLRAVFDDYFDYYNNERPQWNLGKLTPNEVEQNMVYNKV